MKIPLLLALLLTSCASDKNSKKNEDPDSPKSPEKRIVGRIASVSKTGQFVLIQKLGAGLLPVNMIYQSKGPGGRTASLRPSGERVRDFYAADLLSGSVEQGDAVVAYPIEAQKKEASDKDRENEDPETLKSLEEEILPSENEDPKSDQGPDTIKDSD